MKEVPGPEMSESSGWADLTLSMSQVADLAWRWLPAIVACTFLPYLLVWGVPDMPEWPGLWNAVLGLVIGAAAFVFIYAASALAHEALHLGAMIVVGGVPPSSLRFGMRLSEGVLYVHTSRPMSAWAYRVVLVTPALVLGIVPTVLGTFYGWGWPVAYGFVMLASALGDFAVLHLIRHVDARTPVRDHPKEIGCQVLVNPPPA